jgi:hypothetical protein
MDDPDHYCPQCTWHISLVAEALEMTPEHVRMVKVMPLGIEVGGFLWQCPRCKTIRADWTPIEQSKKEGN